MKGIMWQFNIAPDKREYGKCPKISNTLFRTFLPKFCFKQLFLIVLCGLANTVDSNQPALGAVWSGSALFANNILSENLVYQILGQIQ